jgi:RNA polymerase sigma-70 factor (ECF subfamily)
VGFRPPPQADTVCRGTSATRSLIKALVSTDDTKLIEECLAGRTEAFGQLVVRYQDRLIHTLVHVLGSREDALDTAQNAFVHAFQKLSTFKGDSAFYSWLFRIAMNSAISSKRKNRRVTSSIDGARESAGIEPIDNHPGTQPSHAMELSEQQVLVRKALDRLPEEYRTVLVLKEMDGLKYEEIAETLDIPIGTVRSRIFRAREELRGMLQSVLQPD